MNKYVLFLDDERTYPTQLLYSDLKKHGETPLTSGLLQQAATLFYNKKDDNDNEFGNTPIILVRNYSEFVECIASNYNNPEKFYPYIISFDHNLADEHHSYNTNPIPYHKFINPSGWHCVKWFLNFCTENKINRLPSMICHSYNDAGKSNIHKLLREYKQDVRKNKE